ncbi:rhomboid family intramembrane serine protease [Terrimonas sp. NA20]|uniref:Rhomboid family intramembrane serine protease n=1 Tax=Terrimonas ginsenosidimutans TaxID=2908004 RepID=A0ABS9KPS2_9BACT|nr:rhomboid family intramembrane serine protease [Terrimonas ginsenosidimutans]MCG2614327.1 rhomboid family intramembrane serine protease [Terrimonas ginsenosidimutans]
MTDTGIISLILIAANIAFSYKGFTNQSFFEGYKFEVDKILVHRDYKRLITSGFLHVNWTHLIFNMISLLLFSGAIEYTLGSFRFLIIYFVSLIGGSLLSLFIHRNHGSYSAVGASGAVCGIIFAAIALFPGIGVGFFFLPVSIPGWVYGVVYVAYSIYGIRSNKDNIGHEAHLGGALIGMAVALILEPAAFSENYLTILIILVPAIAFIVLIITKPHALLIDNFYFKTQKNYYSIDHKYNEEKMNSQREIDDILDKIGRKGMDSLSTTEKEKLKRFSRKI